MLKAWRSGPTTYTRPWRENVRIQTFSTACLATVNSQTGPESAPVATTPLPSPWGTTGCRARSTVRASGASVSTTTPSGLEMRLPRQRWRITWAKVAHPPASWTKGIRHPSMATSALTNRTPRRSLAVGVKTANDVSVLALWAMARRIIMIIPLMISCSQDQPLVFATMGAGTLAGALAVRGS